MLAIIISFWQDPLATQYIVIINKIIAAVNIIIRFVNVKPTTISITIRMTSSSQTATPIPTPLPLILSITILIMIITTLRQSSPPSLSWSHHHHYPCPILFTIFFYLLHSTGQDLQLPRGKGHKMTSRSHTKVPLLTHPPPPLIHVRKTATALGTPG